MALAPCLFSYIFWPSADRLGFIPGLFWVGGRMPNLSIRY